MQFRVGVVEFEVQGEQRKMVSLEITTGDGVFVQRVFLEAEAARELSKQFYANALEAMKVSAVVKPS